MAAHAASLFQYLTRPNPTLNVRHMSKGSNTTALGGAWKEPLVISEWDDFRPRSLSSIYDGQLEQILNKHAPCPEPPDIPPFPFCEIHDEASLEGLLTLWSHQIVSYALTTAQKEVRQLSPTGEVYMARGGQAELLTSDPKEDKKRCSHPDWAAIKKTACMNEKQSKPKNVLPGDTKLSSKWTSSMVEKGDQTAFLKRRNHVAPVLQVFNYCLKANARYGFIITDMELVVLRIGVVEGSGKSGEQGRGKGKSKGKDTGKSKPTVEESLGDGVKDEMTGAAPSHGHETQPWQTLRTSEAQEAARRFGKVELMSIPWDCRESSQRSFDSALTVNLALWWLHILAGVASEIELEYPILSAERLPAACPSNNVSFSTGIKGLNLATASFDSHNGNREKSPRKRKSRSSSRSRAKPSKRKFDSK